MLDRLWSQFSRHAATNPSHRSSAPRRFVVRLHAERLEERLLMAADDPLTDNAFADTLTTTDENPPDPVVAASMATRAAATATVSPADATDPGWEQFGSKAAFEAWLIEAAVAQYGHLFGQRYGGWYPWVQVRDFDGRGLVTTFAATTDNHSSTNLQVAGVDEADLIETDGSYLYIISGEDLVIVRAGVGDDLQVISRIHIGGKPVGMFLSGDRLAIVSEEAQSYSWDIGRPLLIAWDAMYFHDPAPPKTTVTILDVEDRAAPSLVQKTEMDGQLIASRVVDGELRLVLNSHFRLPAPISKPVAGEAAAKREIHPIRLEPVADIDIAFTDVWLPNWYNDEYVYETQEEYLARLRETMDTFLPQLRNLGLDGEVISAEPLVDPATLYRPDSAYDHSITTIATFDLDSNQRGPVDTESVMTSGALQVHATTDALYLFSQKPYDPNATDYSPKTIVRKFDMDGGRNGIKLASKGTFDGSLLNQFSADERNGFLRVVVEAGAWGQSGHALHVLQQVGRKLEVVGSIDGIAAGERLYSVRFMEERAFFVTFRQVDPLFAVDLSDPTDPRLLGELHIPGYSDYLQPIDDTHLLAIGRDADETTGLFEELQVSIFDVSDLANPRLLHRHSFDGGRSTVTPATGDRWTRGNGDHHAVSYFAESQTLAFPIFTADAWSTEGGTLFPVGDGGLQVFKIDVDTGFTPLGIIEHETLVERSVRIGDHLFAISSGTVTVHDLADPTLQLGDVSIASSDAPLTELLAHPWQLAIETAIDGLRISTDQMQPESEQSTKSDLASTAAWASPSVAQFRNPERTSLSNSTNVNFRPRVDPKLIDLLAAHHTSRESSGDLDSFELSEASEKSDWSDRTADDLDSLLSDSALERTGPANLDP